MPSAPDYLREEFGVDDLPVIEYLKGNGFKLNKDWTWTAPDRELTDKELRAVQFLILEWDFGGIM